MSHLEVTSISATEIRVRIVEDVPAPPSQIGRAHV